MNPNEDRTTRWLAYLLGDLEPDDAARVEAEMRDDPAKAEEVRKFFEATTDWAKRPVAESPIDMAELAARTRGAAKTVVGRVRFRTAWPWAAAAALLIAALSQASFSVQLGGAAFAWGNPPEAQAVTQLETQISTLNEAYTELAANNLRLYNSFEDFVFSLQQLEIQLQLATAELAQNQQHEAYTRYADMERLHEMMLASTAVPYRNDPVAVPANYTEKP